MMVSMKFKTCLKHVLMSEGGKVDHPDDEGGRTNQGVTQDRYDEWRKAKNKPKRDVWDMSDSERDAIYHEYYWQPLSCEKMPLPIAYMVFDSGVLHGTNFTPKTAQKAIGVLADGVIGPVTLAAAKAQNPLVVWERFRELRWARMQSRKSFPTFKAGWTKRLNDVERVVKSMVRLPSE